MTGSKNYYNEIDPKLAAVLRELISQGLIADGVVDERSIEDVVPSDLKGFTQCHFFAGIGGWSLALRLAGWPDDKPIWTGSCPCQPFSSAGKGLGFEDERHLWPSWFHLIKQCNPPGIFGEQVASKNTDPWFDLVQADLESMDYAFGCVAFPSASIGSPNIRDRAYWLADANSERYQGGADRAWQAGRSKSQRGSTSRWLADSVGSGSQEQFGRRIQSEGSSSDGSALRLADTDGDGCKQGDAVRSVFKKHDAEHGGDAFIERPSTSNGFWRNADWLQCRDGKWRPVESGTFPLAHGVPARVVRLRGYGNAINPYAAKAFIEASGLLT